MYLVRALCDNTPDSSKELGFRRGNVMIVQEEDPGGREGWLQCQKWSGGNSGLVPEDYTKCITGVSDGTEPDVSCLTVFVFLFDFLIHFP